MSVKHLLLALSFIGALGTLQLAQATEHKSGEAEKSFDLPSQPLATALLQFSRQSEVPVVVAPDLIADKVAPAVKGSYTPSSALSQLLGGTGLKAAHQQNGGVTLVLAGDRSDNFLPRNTGVQFVADILPSDIVVAQNVPPSPPPAPITVAQNTRGAEATAPPAAEEITVTGTLLKRIELEPATPISVLKDDYLKNAGKINAEQVVGYINQIAMDTASAGGLATGGSGVFANLRGLGDQRTVVLLDGKRMVSNPYSDLGVDLNSLPLALLDHVEVLANGASAIYGSDAIAGVINFITKKDFEGLDASIYTNQPQQAGGETYSMDIAAGFGNLAEDRWNVSLGLSGREQRPVTCLERTFCQAFNPNFDVLNRTNPFSFPATYTQSQTGLSAINPYSPGCGFPISLYANGKGGANGCVFNTGVVDDIVTQQHQYQLQAKASYRITENNTLSLQFALGHEDLTNMINPTNISGISMTSNNPFYPGNGITPGHAGLNPAFPIAINMKDIPLGGEVFNPITDTHRTLLQDDGSFWGFDYSLWGLESGSESIMYYRYNFANTKAILPGFTCSNGAPCLNAFGPQTAAGAQFFYNNRVAGPVERVTGSLRMVGGQISRDLFDLPAGPVSFALATDYRQDTAAYFTTPALALPIGSGPDGDVPEAGRDNDVSVTAETNIPLLANLPFAKKLEVGASLRVDNYNNVGEAGNPQFTFRYQPTDQIVIRSSYGTGFRVPTLYELYGPVFVTTGNRIADPVLCPNGVVNTAAGGNSSRDCGFLTTDKSGGNPSLSPEVSSTLTAGVAVQPLPSVNFSVDYWSYYLKHAVGSLTDFTISGNVAKFGNLIIRCNSVPASEQSRYSACAFGGSGNPIAYYQTTNVNLGNTQTNGVDFTLNYQTETPLGHFNANYRSTWTWNYKYQISLGANYVNRAGTFHNDVGGALVALPYVHYVTFDLYQNDWSEEIRNKYETGYNDCDVACGDLPGHKAGDYWLWDVFATYSGFPHVTITAGIQNVANAKPSVTNSTPGFSYSPYLSDLLGRAFSLRVSYKL